VKCAGDENPGNALSGELEQVFAAAHPAGGEDLSGLRPAPDFLQTREIGARVAADPAQRHDDHARRPQLRLCQQLRRADEPVPAKVQGERQPLLRQVSEALEHPGAVQRLAADHQDTGIARQPGATVRFAGHAAVDP
jgi:hypothetical protein